METTLEEQPKVFDTRLAGVAQKLKEQAAAQATNDTPKQEEPVSTPEKIDKVTEPVATQEPAKETEPTQKPATEVTQQPEIDWDDSKPATPTQADVSFEKIGSALKFEGIKSESDLVAKFNELNTELAQYKEKATSLSGIPEEFKPVLEIAAKGGDWKSYINPVDYTKVDPVALYEHEASKLPQFRNPDGSFNKEKFEEVLDSIPETTKELEGSRIAQQRQFEQTQFRQQQQALIQQRKEAQDRDLAEAAKKLSKLFPVEQYGIKFDERHSEQIYKGINDGSLLKKHFLKQDGSYDMEKLVSTIAKAEHAEKMLKHIAGKATVAAKKEILQQTTNPQVTTTSTSAAPEALNEKPLSPAEKILKWKQSQEGLK